MILTLQKLLHQMTVLTIVMGLVFPAPLFAAEVELDAPSGTNFRVGARDSDNKYILKSLVNMPKKTIIEIPDDYLLCKNGSSAVSNGQKNCNESDVDLNSSINNWIKRAALPQMRYDENGTAKTDYFFNVKIVSMPGSNNYNLQQGFVNLKALAIGNNLKLKLISAAPLYQAPAPKHEPKKQASEKPNTPHKKNQATAELAQTEGKVCLGDCDKDPTSIQKIRADITETLKKVQRATGGVLNRNDSEFSSFKRNFEKSCFGLKYDDFVQHIKKEALAQNINPEVMLGIFSIETDGHCDSVGDKDLAEKSLGLFQINTGSAPGLKLCSKSQYAKMQGKTIEQMETDPSLRCLQNPGVNLQTGLNIFKEKYENFFHIKMPSGQKRWGQLSDAEKDNYRMAISAYNGGEKWVDYADRDLKIAAEKYGFPVKEDWETRRLFFFRHVLEDNGTLAVTKDGHRKTDSAISNLAYVEGVAGRGRDGAKQTGYADIWEKVLYDEPSNSVAEDKK